MKKTTIKGIKYYEYALMCIIIRLLQQIYNQKKKKKELKKINRKIRQVLPNFIDDNNDIVVIRPRKSHPKKLQKINKKNK